MWLILYPMVMSKMWPNHKAVVYGLESVYIFVNFKGFVIFLWNMMGHKFSSVVDAINIMWATQCFIRKEVQTDASKKHI